MSRRHVIRVVLVAALLVSGGLGAVLTQERPLTVVSVSPDGEIASIADGAEIRIVFSEPMVELGGVVTTPPSWLSIAPAVRANYYWSGTRTIIATIDPDIPLPFATRFTVTVGTTARSTAGKPLAAPRSWSFLTPTVRLLSADWYRRNGRAGEPAILALRFNQPVRPPDVLAHVEVRHEPHTWQVPSIGRAARERLEREDPAGLARFDAKVSRTLLTTQSTSAVPVTLAATWDERRFPLSPNLVVLETTEVPQPEAWLRISTTGVPGLGGAERGPAQSSVVRLESALFADMQCVTACAPGTSNIRLRRNTETIAVQRAVTVTDLTTAQEARLNQGESTGYYYAGPSGTTTFTLNGLGYPNQPPASKWMLRLDENLSSVDGQVLGYPWLEIVENLHAPALLSWPGQVWESANGTAVPLMAQNVSAAEIWSAPIPPGDILSRLLAFQGRTPQLFPASPSAIRRLNLRADAYEGHGIELKQHMNAGGTGLVWATARVSDALPDSARSPFNIQPQPTLLQITNLGVTVKEGPQSTLVFVTRLDNAQPVPGASITIHTTKGPLWTGTTSTDGVAMAPALRLRAPGNAWMLSYVVSARKDADIAWVASNWTGDIDGGSMGIWSGLDEQPDVLRGAVFFDREIYAKGDEVSAKAILRNDTYGGMRMLAPGTRIVLRTRDSRGSEIDRRVLAVNRWGSVDWSIRLPAEAALGGYTVRALLEADAGDQKSNGNDVSGRFQVSAFRRPDFRVDTTLTAATPVLGATLSGSIEGRYLFGASVGTQPVRWYTIKSPSRSIPKAVTQKYPDRAFAFGYQPDASSAREIYQSTEARSTNLDANGRLHLDLPTTPGDDWTSTMRLEGEVRNAAGQAIANRAEVVLHPASFYVGLGRPAYFVDVRNGLTTSVVVADLDGSVRRGVPVTVTLWREHWVSERQPRNPSSWDWVRKEVAAGEWKVKSGSTPTSMAVPLKDGGSYVLRAMATDERGRPTRTDVRFYALGGGPASWRNEGNKITLVPERETWRPGETARVLVQSPWEQATALVTKEREGIRTYSRVQITSAQDAVTVPITEADVPNVYVSVVLVKGRTPGEATADDPDPGKPAIRVGYTQLEVDTSSKKLAVTVRANRQEFRPRERLDVNVTVADAAGKPRASEVTLWAMDYGLLSLTGYETPDAARAIYANRQLQVTTQDNRLRLIGRRSLAPDPTAGGLAAAGGSGGGGGRGGQAGSPLAAPAMMAESLVMMSQSGLASAKATVDLEMGQMDAGGIRRDFRPLVFWLGSVATDSAGRASTTVTLPDSLTTYRIMAVAGDLQSHFGSADTEIKTSKPLTMLASFPRFLSRGDRASFGAIVTNGTGREGNATVTIHSLDPVLDVGATTSQTIRLAAGESKNVRFDALARDTGSARVRLTATLGADTDAFEQPLVISTPLILETVAAYGDTDGSATERVRLPPGAAPNRGGLTVNLSSTALVGLAESARYVQEYPYECAEQQASRALAMLLSADLGSAFGARGANSAELRATGQRLIRDLAQYQCGDGGFALFPGGCNGPSSLYLTAYVLHILQRASALGVSTTGADPDRALNFIQNQLRQPPPEAQWWPAWAASQAFAVRVLAEGGRNPRADIDRLYGFVDRMPVFALSYLADAFAAVNDRGPRYNDVVRRISNALRVDADRAHVQEVDDAALVWLWNTNVRATAVVLDGLSRRKDDGTLVAPLVRWLLASRENGRWSTTQENAVALAALVSYYRTFESVPPAFTANVTLAGRQIGDARFSGRTTAAEEIRLDMSALAAAVGGDASRDLVLSRDGAGRLFYTARLQYATETPAAPVDKGIRIERRYQRFSAEGLGSPASSFADGDLVRVTLSITLPHEGRFLAFTDPIPAGFEPVDGTLRTTAQDLGAVSTTQSDATDRFAWWRRGGFDHVEKHDDKVRAFATRLSAGKHELTYLVRATTAGTVGSPGTELEFAL